MKIRFSLNKGILVSAKCVDPEFFSKRWGGGGVAWVTSLTWETIGMIKSAFWSHNTKIWYDYKNHPVRKGIKNIRISRGEGEAFGRMASNITSFMAINSPLSMLTAEYTLPYWPSPVFTKQNNQIYQVSLGTGNYCIGMDQFCTKISKWILPQSHVIEKYLILLYAIAWSRLLHITHTHGW